MAQYTRMSILPPAMCAVALLVAAGCGGGNNAASNTAQDTTMQMAQPNAGNPQLNDQPRRRASAGETESGRRRTASESTTTSGGAAPGATHMGTIPSGTAMTLASSTRVCTNTHHVGDQFTATTTDAVMGTNGAMIPAGSPVDLTVTKVKASNNMTQAGQIGVSVDSIVVNGVTYPLDAQITSATTNKVRSTSMGQEATKVGIGAAAGGILGQVIGHDAKSTIIGAAAGAAAGGGVAAATTKYDFCIPQNGHIAIKTTSDEKVPASTS